MNLQVLGGRQVVLHFKTYKLSVSFRRTNVAHADVLFDNVIVLLNCGRANVVTDLQTHSVSVNVKLRTPLRHVVRILTIDLSQH